jgi:ATP-dependent Clp protease ATP-binding subunit ClpX
MVRKTGARGLRAIMEKTMINAMYNVPSDDTITEVIITKESVDGKADPDYIKGKKPSKDGKRILRQKEPKGKISEI